MSSLLVKHPKHYKNFARRALIQFAIILLAGVILIPQLNELFNNRRLLGELSLFWLCLAVAAYSMTYVCAALVYQNLSFRHLKFFRNVLVQIATGFTNRLLPSGIGGLGTNVLFLTRSGFSRPAAVALSIANNLLGFIAFACVLFISGAFSPTFIKDIFEDVPAHYAWIAAAVLLVAVVVLLRFKKVRKAISYNFRQAIIVFRSLTDRPVKLLFGLISSIGITAFAVTALYCCLKSAGIHLPVDELVFVFAAGVLAISVSPTPGGLGVAEIGLVLGLGQIGRETAPALAAVAAFRILSFWLPIVPGYISFRIISARRYI